MTDTAKMILEVRDATGAGYTDSKKALELHDWDPEIARVSLAEGFGCRAARMLAERRGQRVAVLEATLAAAEAREAALRAAAVPMENALQHLSGFICGESDDPKDYVRSVAVHALSKAALALATAETAVAVTATEGSGCKSTPTRSR